MVRQKMRVLPLVLASLCLLAMPCWGQEKPVTSNQVTDVLDDQQKQDVEDSVDRALEFLVAQQQDDGSFDSISLGQPGVTSLGVMAFLAQGKRIGEGDYGDSLQDAVNFIIAQQKPNGLLATVAPMGSPISRKFPTAIKDAGSSAYNHAISGLALSEAYGQCDESRTPGITQAIEKALAATLEMQNWGKDKRDRGGWRYVGAPWPDDSDISVTCWQLMFLRSAKVAGFDVPVESIESAVNYIDNVYDKKEGVFIYAAWPGHRGAINRTSTGAGILSLAHAGKQDTEMVRRASDWLLKREFTTYGRNDQQHAPYGDVTWLHDQYHYAAFTCTHAMHKLGGAAWNRFYPPVVKTLLANQNPDGSWPPERINEHFKNSYTTSLSVLTMSVSGQLLPIFQR